MSKITQSFRQASGLMTLISVVCGVWMVAVCVMASPAHAKPGRARGAKASKSVKVSAPLMRQMVSLKGLEASATFTVKLPPKALRRSAPELELVWLPSQMVQVERSSLSVELNQQPIHSQWLAGAGGKRAKKGRKKGRKGLKASAPSANVSTIALDADLPGGFHQLTVRVRLSVGDDDPCLEEFHDGAWVNLFPNSAVHWKAARSLAKDAPKVAVGDFPALWQQAPVVHVDLAADWSPQMGLALVEAEHLLRRWGLETTLEPSLDGRGARLALTTVSEAPASLSDAVEVLTRSEATAALEPSGQTLWVIGRDVHALAGAVAALGQEQLRQTCQQSPCLLGALPNVEGQEGDAQDAAVVWTMARQTPQTGGWVAKGLGRHVLEFVWERPALVSVAPWPVLDLRVRAASGLSKHSRISVSINDSPVATYGLDDLEGPTSGLKIRVPRDFWAAPRWAFRVSVNLERDEEVPCAAFDPESAWLALGSASKLTVPRSIERFEGLAHFFQQATAPPAIIWNKDAGPEAIRALAAILFPFAQRHPEHRWGFFEGQGEAVELVMGSMEALESVLVEGRLHWSEPTGSAALPLVTAEHAPAVHLSGPKLLTVQLATASPSAPKASWPVLPYEALSFERAVWTQARGWVMFGARPLPLAETDILAPSPEPVAADTQQSGAPPAVPVSEQESRLLVLNVVWGVMTVLGLLGLLWFWRRRDQKRRTSLTTQSAT